MNCPYCHNRIGANDQFCMYCGQPLSGHRYGSAGSSNPGSGPGSGSYYPQGQMKICPLCHTPVPAGTKRCPICQTKLKKVPWGLIAAGIAVGAGALAGIVLAVLVITGVIRIGDSEESKPVQEPVSDAAREDQEAQRPSEKEDKEEKADETVPDSEKPAAAENQEQEPEEEPAASALEEYILSESSQRLLSASELVNLSSEELRLARNEIYARHGRKFQNPQMQAYFNARSWYSGTIAPEDFTEDLLSEMEKRNIALIQEEEQRR